MWLIHIHGTPIGNTVYEDEPERSKKYDDLLPDDLCAFSEPAHDKILSPIIPRMPVLANRGRSRGSGESSGSK
jgi:hypothetical protein